MLSIDYNPILKKIQDNMVYFKYFCILKVFLKMAENIRVDYKIGPEVLTRKQFFPKDLLLSMSIVDIIASEFLKKFADHKDSKLIEKTFICYNVGILQQSELVLGHLNKKLDRMALEFPNYVLLFPPHESNAILIPYLNSFRGCEIQD